jgi:hypothetical protein
LRLEEFVGRAERSPAEVAQVAADIEALEAIAARE